MSLTNSLDLKDEIPEMKAEGKNIKVQLAEVSDESHARKIHILYVSHDATIGDVREKAYAEKGVRPDLCRVTVDEEDKCTKFTTSELLGDMPTLPDNLKVFDVIASPEDTLFLFLSVGRLVLRFIAVVEKDNLRKFLPIYGYPLQNPSELEKIYDAEIAGPPSEVGRGSLMCFSRPSKKRTKFSFLQEVSLSTEGRDTTLPRISDGSVRDTMGKDYRDLWVLEGAHADFDSKGNAIWRPLFYNDQGSWNQSNSQVEFLYASRYGKPIGSEYLDSTWICDSLLTIRHYRLTKQSIQQGLSCEDVDNVTLPRQFRNRETEEWEKLALKVLGDESKPTIESENRYWALYFDEKGGQNLQAVYGPSLVIHRPLLQYVKVFSGENSSLLENAIEAMKIEDDLFGGLSEYALYVYHHKGLVLEEEEAASIMGWKTREKCSPFWRLKAMKHLIAQFLSSLHIPRDYNNTSATEKSDKVTSEGERVAVVVRERMQQESKLAAKRVLEYLEIVRRARDVQNKALKVLDSKIPVPDLRFSGFDPEKTLEACARDEVNRLLETEQE